MARSVLCAGLGMFRLSCMYCVSVVTTVVVECRTLKPCCVGDRRMCGVIMLRINLSRILIGMNNKENQNQKSKRLLRTYKRIIQ